MSRRSNSTPTLASSFDDLRNDYNAARSSRFRRRRTGVNTQGSGADYHYRNESDYLKVMEYARDMDRNDTIVGQTIDRAVTNMIQDGIPNDPQTGDDAVNKDLRALWTEWSEDADQCDLAGERTFWELEQLVPRQSLVDGDIFALPNRDGAIELVEAHRCRTPRKHQAKRGPRRAFGSGHPPPAAILVHKGRRRYAPDRQPSIGHLGRRRPRRRRLQAGLPHNGRQAGLADPGHHGAGAHLRHLWHVRRHQLRQAGPATGGKLLRDL